MQNNTWHTVLNDVRVQNGFLTLEDMMDLAARNTVFDPYSTLIARDARIGSGNVFYPGVVVRCDSGGECRIGDANTFHPATLVVAAAGGRVTIGDGCSLGPGGVQIKANQPKTDLRIGNGVRLLNGAEIVGSSLLGDGSQIIGAVAAQSVELGGGQDFTGPDPDLRGAVLKGFGLARAVRLNTGDVVNGAGDFASAPIERQLAYHPRSKA
ncbi:hypothetical protein [Streptomyces sp. NBC_00273]|uniref:hypothetical protein n=1 Tax=Streptomyces sp. NBC_00273 TaxID=2903644 RepID=UPI002E2869B6|nr:hypothetical protein [Streptomyces sp. NBC_00273]